jgi:hypothetical protein
MPIWPGRAKPVPIRQRDDGRPATAAEISGSRLAADGSRPWSTSWCGVRFSADMIAGSGLRSGTGGSGRRDNTPCNDIPCGAYRQCFGLVLRQ